LNQLPSLFAIAYELSPVTGAKLLSALDVPAANHTHERLHDWLLAMAARRLFDREALWR
jgi:hypothetical protein